MQLHVELRKHIVIERARHFKGGKTIIVNFVMSVYHQLRPLLNLPNITGAC